MIWIQIGGHYSIMGQSVLDHPDVFFVCFFLFKQNMYYMECSILSCDLFFSFVCFKTVETQMDGFHVLGATHLGIFCKKDLNDLKNILLFLIKHKIWQHSLNKTSSLVSWQKRYEPRSDATILLVANHLGSILLHYLHDFATCIL